MATARRDFPNEAGQPVPRALITFDPAICGLTAAEIGRLLWAGDPSIAVAQADDGIALTPDTLEPGEEEMITKRLLDLVLQRGDTPHAYAR